MKNDSFLSNEMDLPEENASCDGSDDGENEFTNVSSYNQGEAFEAKQSGNVNSSPSQWPLRHNNHNESLERQSSYSCNGIRQAKKPRYTCAGRISRIPSRYLDTDSDSGDGSARKDGQNRLKIKQRSRRKRKLPSSTSKLLVNGFKEHDDALLFSVAGFEMDRNTDNLSECLANVDYSDIFEDTSPISNDTISNVAHETEYKNNSHPDTLLSNEIVCSASSQGDVEKGESILIVASSRLTSNQTAEHSSTSSGCCVDISCKDNGRARFQSLMESNEGITTEIHRVDAKNVENCSTILVNTSCKRKNLDEASKCDSSTRQALVIPEQISKDLQVSCAIHNDSTGIFLERENCKSCRECTVNSTCILTENAQSFESSEFVSSDKITGDIGSKLSKKKRLVKTTKRPRKKLALQDKLKDSEANTLPCQAEALECLKDLKMRKAFAKKFKQKQLRRKEKTDKNDVLKRSRKNGVICKVKQKAFGKVNSRKMATEGDKMNRKVDEFPSKVKDAEVTKASDQSEELDRVLGMRQSPNGVYEFLVEWRNGTSCWVSSDEIVKDKHNYYLREYLIESEQDVSVVNRVPFKAYCCDSLSLKECKPGLKSKKALARMLCVEETVPKPVCKVSVVSTKQKDNVSVDYEDEYCYITLNRETCKRKNTSLKIMADLITAFENAATSECEAVVLCGLQSDVLCGLKLSDMSKTGAEKENGILCQARYLVQTLTNYPKLLIALISKSAEGIGAVFLSLFDMICDEETWDKKEILDPCKEDTKVAKAYTLPRLTGHSLLSEEILMGKHIEDSGLCNPISSAYQTLLTDSSIVTNTLMEIEATLRLLGKHKSLLETDGESSELFSTAEPSFASFADIKGSISSEHESGSYFNDATEGTTMVDDKESLSKCTVNDKFLANTTNKECEIDERLNQNTNESSTATDISKDHLHRVPEVNANPSEITTDNATTVDISTDFTVTDDCKTEQSIADQSTTDDAVILQSSTKHTNTHQDTTTDCTNTDHSSMEQSTIDYVMTEESLGSHGNTEHNTMDYTIATCENAVDHTTMCDQTTNDLVIPDKIIVDEEVNENKMLDSAFDDQTRTIATGTCAVAESAVDNASDDLRIDNGMCVDNLVDSSSLKTTDDVLKLAPVTNISNSNSNHADYIKHENSLDQTRAITEPAVTDTNLIQTSTDSISNDVTMVSIDNTDGAINGTRSDTKTDSYECECHVENKRTLITSIDKIVVEYVKTNHDCTENTENLSTGECDRSNFSNNNTTDKNDVTLDKCDNENDNMGELSPTIRDLNDEISEQDLRTDVTDEEGREKDCDCSSKNENAASVINNISNVKVPTNQSENSEGNFCKLEPIACSTENLEGERTIEQGNCSTILDSNTANKNKQTITNDNDISNYLSTVDSCADENLESMTKAITDPIHDNSPEHAGMDESGISASTDSAVDRYLRKLEAEIDAEKWKAQQYIEQISRLWDSPFLCKNK